MSSHAELLAYLESLPVVDTHEHLPFERERLAQNVDFATLFSHYCRDDLWAAGMTNPQMELLFGAASVERKWEVLSPFLPRTETSAYMRAARLAMAHFYGVDELRTLQDAQLVTERIRAANAPGLYERVFRDCGIRRVVNCNDGTLEPPTLHSVKFIGEYAQLYHRNQVLSWEARWDRPLPTLRHYTQALLEALAADLRAGVTGFKTSQAYVRALDYDAATEHEAQKAYDSLWTDTATWSPIGLDNAASKPLEDYLTRRIVEFAGDNGVPMVIHVGFQTGQDMRLDNARPHRLLDLLRRYRHTRFAMLHGGLPWVHEGAVMARQLPNLSVDMGWMHIMCPELAVLSLKYCFDMVPSSKVMGFGGDYSVVEKIYGHLHIARRNIARALSDRVDEGAMTLPQARRWCRALMHDSADSFYGLGLGALPED